MHFQDNCNKSENARKLNVEVGPVNTARGLGSAVSSPAGVWIGAPAEIEFGAF